MAPVAKPMPTHRCAPSPLNITIAVDTQGRRALTGPGIHANLLTQACACGRVRHWGRDGWLPWRKL